MILLVFLFFIVGMFAIFLEVFVPHGFTAWLGIGLIVAAIYIAVHQMGWQTGMLYCLMALVLSLVFVRFTIWNGMQSLKLAPPKKRDGSKPAAEKGEATEPQAGDRATVAQLLRPTGTIEWRGQRLPARALSPESELPVGAEVEIHSRDGTYWVVKEHNAS